MRHLLIALTALACSVGCGGDEPSDDFDNHAACLAYFDAYSALPCADNAPEPDPDESCAGSDVDCDFTGYYDCLAEGWECQGVPGAEVPVQTNTCEVPDC